MRKVSTGSDGCSSSETTFSPCQQPEEDAMLRTYRILYQVGFTPWERMTRSRPIGEQISALFVREEQAREPPYGQALDLGCGSGIWAVKLAGRGWQVTGLDFVPKALRRARERAQEAGVEVRLIEGDVTALRATSVGSGFRFLLDFGLFHDLTDELREEMGREVSAVAAPGATMLMLAWAPGRRRLLPRGASRGDIEAAYPAWKVIDEEALVDEPRAPKYVRKADPRFYRLQHE
jgi:SAM-dependent methyltransferase